MAMLINITKPALVRVASIFTAPQGSARYYLTGVHFCNAEQGGIYIVSTDGFRASIGYDPEGVIEESCIIRFPRAFLKYLKPDTQLSIDGRTVTVTDKHGNKDEALVTMIDGTFPDWQRVVPDFDSVVSYAAFDPAYLADYKAARSALGLKHGSVHIVGQDKVSTHRVTINGVDNWFGLLMPMRGDMPSSLPAWFGEKQTKAA